MRMAAQTVLRRISRVLTRVEASCRENTSLTEAKQNLINASTNLQRISESIGEEQFDELSSVIGELIGIIDQRLNGSTAIVNVRPNVSATASTESDTTTSDGPVQQQTWLYLPLVREDEFTIALFNAPFPVSPNCLESESHTSTQTIHIPLM